MSVNETMEHITNGTETPQPLNSQLLNSLNVKDISVKIFEDFTRTWSWILIGLLFAMLLSLLFLLLLRYVAGVLVWILIVGVVSIIAYGIYHCYMEYDMLRKKGATIQTVGLTTNWSAYGSVKETWMVALIVLCVVEAILLLSLVFLRNRIFIAIALIKEASRAIGHMMSTLIYPLLTFILIVICVAYWGMTALYPFRRCYILLLPERPFFVSPQQITLAQAVKNIMIAIYGKNFCVSAKNAFNLLMRNVVRVIILDKVTDLLLLFGKLLVVGGIGILSFFFFTGRIPTENPQFKSPVLNYYWLPILTVVVGSYLIAQGFFSVYMEDLERNDGSQEKPYYMSKSLMKILNKKNQKAKDK
ncbi:hypothetical protein L345_13277, partial [Ophiophagus hannah]